MVFTSDEDLAIANEYSDLGYIIRKNADKDAYKWIQQSTASVAANALNIAQPSDNEKFLNEIHNLVEPSALNDFRLKVIQGLNALPEFRLMYFRLAKPYLEAIVGNELAMQQRINLSIQMPNDSSSLLPVHADT